MLYYVIQMLIPDEGGVMSFVELPIVVSVKKGDSREMFGIIEDEERCTWLGVSVVELLD